MSNRIENDIDETRVARLGAETFNFPVSEWEIWSKNVPIEDHRVLRESGTIVAACGLYRAGQWYGGQRVSMAGFALVCVDPTVRKRGHSQRLLTATLNELHEEGVGLSTLYPSTQQPYRRVGFEQGGHYLVYEQELYPAQQSVDLLPIHQVETLARDEFEAVDRRRAAHENGVLDRSTGLWRRVFRNRDNPTPTRGYLIGDRDNPEGYIICMSKATGDNRRLVIKDRVATTPAAAATLWQFIYSHRSVCERVVWPGSPNDPLLMASAECRPRITDTCRWMSRVVNLKSALEQRGFPNRITGKLLLEVDDPIVPGNAGQWILDVAEGRGTLARPTTVNSEASLSCSIQGLSTLYTGLIDAFALKQQGLLDGSDETLALASQLFAGSTPWMPDAF